MYSGKGPSKTSLLEPSLKLPAKFKATATRIMSQLSDILVGLTRLRFAKAFTVWTSHLPTSSSNQCDFSITGLKVNLTEKSLETNILLLRLVLPKCHLTEVD